MIGIVFLTLGLIAVGSPSVWSGRTDFHSLYAGGKLVGTPYLYSPVHANRIQRQVTNSDEVGAFIRPPFYAALLWPLAKLNYRQAILVWQLINLIALAGFLLLFKPDASAAVVCCLFFPTWLSFASGQDLPILLFLFAASARLLQKGKDLPAGLVMALCAIKFHVLVLLPVLILARRLWRFSFGLVAGMAGLVGVCFLVDSRDWPTRYFEAVKLNEQLQDSAVQMPNLLGLLFRVPHARYLLTAGTVLVVIGCWVVVRRVSLLPALGFTLFSGLLISLHAYLPDCMLVLPLMLSVTEYTGPAKVMIMTGLIGISTLALTEPRVAFLAQLVMIALFVWVLVESRSTAKFSPP